MFIFLNKCDYFAFAAAYVVAFLKHAAPEFVGRNMWRNVKKQNKQKSNYCNGGWKENRRQWKQSLLEESN